MSDNTTHLSFHDRQKVWSGTTRTFIQNNGRGKRPNIWTIQVAGTRVITTHGVQDGQMQTTDYQGKWKNAGRANALTPEQDALSEARRDALKKYDFEGYDEIVNGENVDLRNEGVSVQHLLTTLPGSFCLYKPENNFWDQKKLLQKANTGDVWYTLKRDGMAKLIIVDFYGNIHIYSRRARAYHKDEGPEELVDGTLDYSKVIPWAARFPHLIEAVRGLNLPPGTMLAGELVFPYAGKDNFAHIQSITKSLTPQSVGDQQSAGTPFFYWWDMPFYGGEDLVTNKPVGERFLEMQRIFQSKGVSPTSIMWIIPMEIRQFLTPELALEEAKARGIEGWVVVDPLGVYGDKGWNVKGKPDRPSICAKLKPKSEDDFIALWDPETGGGDWGTGKHEKDKLVQLPNGKQVKHSGVGSIGLYQYNPQGHLTFISKCASGMDYEFQALLRREDFPFVCRVEYAERTYISDGEKTNALRFPVFIEKRTDKELKECFNDRL